VDHLDLASAWVYVAEQRPGIGACSGGPIGRWPPSTPPASASRSWAVIVDATTGRGYVYQGAGAGICSPSSVPILRPAAYGVSVKLVLRQLTPRTLQQTVYLPPCGTYSSGSYGPHYYLAVAAVPVGPCVGKPSVRTTTTEGHVGYHPYGGLGLICQGVYDATFGKPSDCAVHTL